MKSDAPCEVKLQLVISGMCDEYTLNAYTLICRVYIVVSSIFFEKQVYENIVEITYQSVATGLLCCIFYLLHIAYSSN